MINEIMEYNKKFVENKAYEPYLTSKLSGQETCNPDLYGYPADRAAPGGTRPEKR